MSAKVTLAESLRWLRNLGEASSFRFISTASHASQDARGAGNKNARRAAGIGVGALCIAQFAAQVNDSVLADASPRHETRRSPQSATMTEVAESRVAQVAPDSPASESTRPQSGGSFRPASGSSGTVSKLAPEHSERQHLEKSPFLRHLLHSPTVTVVDSSEVMASLPLSLHDHLFEALKKNKQLLGYTCMFDYGTDTGFQYFAVYRLGAQVCGFPGIVHGGLTAAMCDEAFGGLLQGLKMQGRLPEGPAYTVHLSMQYKNFVPSDTTVVCSAALESLEDDGRKVWMTATLSDAKGPKEGTVYATSRALFVHPKPEQTVKALGKYVKNRMFG